MLDGRFKEKTVGDLTVGIVFRQHKHMGGVDIDAHGSSSPNISDCTKTKGVRLDCSGKVWHNLIVNDPI